MIDTRYPFAAIVGQEQVKKALIYSLIEPRIGGVLLCGEKGTAKSTIVRGLAALTHQEVVDLPLNVTEDMLVGSIDFEQAVQDGTRCFCGGILARANGNILYVDEVNLLPDSIVSTLICAAANGENVVEREGISHRHSCQFILVGTMNPEEGKLRPQFLDRFGLYVDVSGEQELSQRTQIIRRRMEYEKDPAAFALQWETQTNQLQQRIARAQQLVQTISVDESIRHLAARYAQQAGCQGNRCELILVLTACAVAAWDGRTHINANDLKEAAIFVLPHRKQDSSPMPQPPSPTEESEEHRDSSDEGQSQTSEKPQPDDASAPMPPSLEEQEGNDGQQIDIPPLQQDNGSGLEDQVIRGAEVAAISALPALPRDRLFRQGSGRRSKTKSGTSKGRYAGFTQSPKPFQRDLALDATLRAAAPYQKLRPHDGCAVALTEADLRYKVRENHVGATIVFLVDASGSMGVQKRMKETKEAILSMLLDSYQKRDKIGLVAFRKDKAETLLDITASVDLAQKKLQSMPTGGRTPLAAGLYQAWQLLRARRLKDPDLLPMIVLVTDGRANRPLWTEDAVADAVKCGTMIAQDGIHALVIDTEKEFISLHIAQQVAQAMNAAYYKVDDLKAQQLRSLVKAKTDQIGLGGA